jgi:hypothetical protein
MGAILGIPELTPACWYQAGEIRPGGNEATVISIIITISAVLTITVSVIIHVKRRYRPSG